MNAKSPTQRQFLALAIPNMMAAMAVPITTLVHIAYLGHLDSVIPLSGVILATIIFDYIFWSFAFLRVGTTGLVAQAVGRQDTVEQAALFWRPILLGIIIGLTLTLLQIPLKEFGFSILAGGAEVEAAGREYYSTHIWGALPIMINLAIIGWLLGQGRAGIVWLLHTVWQVSNIILNYIFIIEMDLGAWGAGLGTALAEWISLFASISAAWLCWGGLPKFNWEHIRRRDEFKKLLTLNSAIMLRTILLMTVLAGFTNISATFGTIALAANALMMKLFIFYAFVCDGFAIALETLAGRALGKNDRSELKRSLNLSLGWAVGSAIGFIILYMFAAEWILSLLTEHDEVIIAAIPYLGWLCATLFIGGFAFVYDGFFYGLAKPKLLAQSMGLAVAGFAPFAYYAWQNQSTTWLWMGFVLFLIIRAATLVYPAKQAVE